MNTCNLVSVIIPTYNRFTYLMNTISSIQNQTYKNIEIIVVNDCSTQKEYYEYEWKNIIIIHLPQNSKKLFGYACAGYVRNQGIQKATGKYIAFCDDDDIWFPNKLELQINAMKNTNCKMSSTDGFIGHGIYDKNKNYKKYLSEHYYNILKQIYKNEELLPDIWTLKFLKIYNCVICSSVVIEKEILDKIENFKNIKNGREDYDCWLRALKYCNCVYVKEPCFYYDSGHGDGQNY
jgi:glycosyltransferase involved in cell wall biosynthesis